MSTVEPYPRQDHVLDVLRTRIQSAPTRSDAVDDFAQTLNSIRGYCAHLLGEAGADAVLARSVQLANRSMPLAQKVRVDQQGVGLEGLLEHVGTSDSHADEVMSTLLEVGAMLFQTLYELTGDVLTESLLRRLEAGEPK